MNDKDIFELTMIAKRCYWMYEEAIAKEDYTLAENLRYCLAGSRLGRKTSADSVMEPVASVTNLARLYHNDNRKNRGK